MGILREKEKLAVVLNKEGLNRESKSVNLFDGPIQELSDVLHFANVNLWRIASVYPSCTSRFEEYDIPVPEVVLTKDLAVCLVLATIRR